jgi:dTDP-4-dehydrorhamnose reductase
VLRVESLFGGPRAKSSIDKILASIQAGQPTRVFGDRTVTPSYVFDVARATAALLDRGAPSGVYHCVNSGVTNWLELTEELARLTGRADTARLEPVPFASVPLKAKRPQYCALSNAKLRAAGIEMPEWRDALRRYLRRA